MRAMMQNPHAASLGNTQTTWGPTANRTANTFGASQAQTTTPVAQPSSRMGFSTGAIARPQPISQDVLQQVGEHAQVLEQFLAQQTTDNIDWHSPEGKAAQQAIADVHRAVGFGEVMLALRTDEELGPKLQRTILSRNPEAFAATLTERQGGIIRFGREDFVRMQKAFSNMAADAPVEAMDYPGPASPVQGWLATPLVSAEYVRDRISQLGLSLLDGLVGSERGRLMSAVQEYMQADEPLLTTLQRIKSDSRLDDSAKDKFRDAVVTRHYAQARVAHDLRRDEPLAQQMSERTLLRFGHRVTQFGTTSNGEARLKQALVVGHKDFEGLYVESLQHPYGAPAARVARASDELGKFMNHPDFTNEGKAHLPRFKDEPNGQAWLGISRASAESDESGQPYLHVMRSGQGSATDEEIEAVVREFLGPLADDDSMSIRVGNYPVASEEDLERAAQALQEHSRLPVLSHEVAVDPMFGSMQLYVTLAEPSPEHAAKLHGSLSSEADLQAEVATILMRLGHQEAAHGVEVFFESAQTAPSEGDHDVSAAFWALYEIGQNNRLARPLAPQERALVPDDIRAQWQSAPTEQLDLLMMSISFVPNEEAITYRLTPGSKGAEDVMEAVVQSRLAQHFQDPSYLTMPINFLPAP